MSAEDEGVPAEFNNAVGGDVRAVLVPPLALSALRTVGDAYVHHNSACSGVV